MENELRCTKCGETKIKTEFHIRNASKNSRSSWCKECKYNYDKDYRQKNKRLLNKQHLIRYYKVKTRKLIATIEELRNG